MAMLAAEKLLDFLVRAELISRAAADAIPGEDRTAQHPAILLSSLERRGLLKPSMYEQVLKRFDFALHVGAEGPKLQLALRAGYLSTEQIKASQARQLMAFADGRGRLVPILEILADGFVSNPATLQALSGVLEARCELGTACPYRADRLQREASTQTSETSQPISRRGLQLALLGIGGIAIAVTLILALRRPERSAEQLQAQRETTPAETHVAGTGHDASESGSLSVPPDPRPATSSPTNPSRMQEPPGTAVRPSIAPADRSLNLEDLYARLCPSVVVIETFDHSGGPLAQGSGFVVSNDGLVATNQHVIRDALRAKVSFEDGSTVSAEFVGAGDVTNDLALLRIPGARRPSLELGDSDTVRTGQAVFAIGTPRGYQRSLSNGIVSGLRSARDPELGRPMLQMTVPISPGSSGGPLFDEAGRVVGICTSTRLDAQNLNFAVPVNALKNLLARPSIAAPAHAVESDPPGLAEGGTPIDELTPLFSRGQESLTLTDGRRLVGDIILEDGEFVVIRCGNHLAPIPRARIRDLSHR